MSARGLLSRELNELSRVQGFAFYSGISQTFSGGSFANADGLASAPEDVREVYEVQMLNSCENREA